MILRRLFLRRRCTSVFVILATVVIISVRYMLKGILCQEKESLHILENLCRDYEQGISTGNLCPHLCSMHTIWFHSCLNYRDGKHVFKMKWMDEMVIIKTKKTNVGDYNLPEDVDSLDDFARMVADSVTINLPVTSDTESNLEILNRMWMDGVEKYSRSKSDGQITRKTWDVKAINSVWSLIQQDEYLLLKYYEKSSNLPEIHGTCGHFYAMEYMPPGSILMPTFSEVIWKHSWRDRAELALKFLEAIHSFENDLPEVLHLCDMKGENFGISKEGKLAAIDVDMALFDTRLTTDMSYSNCTVHEDCSFFDCQGWCDVATGKCTTIRVNNNLQKLCEKIFMSGHSNMFTGLLRSPPRSIPELTPLVASCASPLPPGDLFPGCSTDGSTVICPPTLDKEPVRYKADHKYYTNLKHLIEVSLA